MARYGESVTPLLYQRTRGKVDNIHFSYTRQLNVLYKQKGTDINIIEIFFITLGTDTKTL